MSKTWQFAMKSQPMLVLYLWKEKTKKNKDISVQIKLHFVCLED